MTGEANRDVANTTYYRRSRRKLSTLALVVRTTVLAGIATLAIGAGLALQMALGKDPVIGSGSTQADAQRPTIVKTTVVKRLVPEASTGSSGGSSSSGSSSYSAPAVSAPAPVTSSSS